MGMKHYVVFFAILLNGCGSLNNVSDKLEDRTSHAVWNSESGLNVLFLISDDLRPELGCYGKDDAPSPVHPNMLTPNLDRLAAKSMLFKKAYVQQALCSPSRTSFLTGRRPDTTHIYSIGPYFRNITGNLTTLPEYFKQQGYITAGLGKVFHGGHSSGFDDPPSWTEPYYHAPNYELWQYGNIKHKDQAGQSWISVPTTVHTKEPLPDQQIAAEASERFEKYARQNKPFFMAVGFRKPHLPFVFPAEFIKYYPSEAVELPPNPYAPNGLPDIAWHNYIKTNLLGKYDDIKYSNYSGNINTSMADNTVLDLRRAYYSSVSYVDSLIGQLLDKLEELGITNRTIISFLGDHGYQLGEHGEWLKQTNFELATRIPMMIHVPGKTDTGMTTDKLVEAVDLYPTIVDAAGLPSVPLCPVHRSTETMLCREGISLMPIITNHSSSWKTAVFSQYPRNTHSNLNDTQIGDAMGYSIRTKHFRYTEWVRFKGHPDYKPVWSVQYGVELYDHVKDPNENRNEANNPEYKTTVSELSKLLHAGWRHVPIKEMIYYHWTKDKEEGDESFSLFATLIGLKMGLFLLALCLCASVGLCIRYRKPNENVWHTAISKIIQRRVPVGATHI